jgi:hypothetical protein
VILRSAGPADVDEVLDVWRRAEAAPSATDDAASLLRLLDDAPDALVVAEREGEDRARARGARRLSALVLAAEPDAVGLWEAVGYDRDRRIVRFTKTR